MEKAMAMAPHWLDSVIGDSWKKGEKDVAQAVANSPQLKKAIEAGIKAATDAEERHKKDPKIMGAAPVQLVRASIVNAITAAH